MMCALDLEHTEISVAETRLARGEIKFPHAAEPFVIECECLVTLCHESPPPFGKRLCVVQA